MGEEEGGTYLDDDSGGPVDELGAAAGLVYFLAAVAGTSDKGLIYILVVNNDHFLVATRRQGLRERLYQIVLHDGTSQIIYVFAKQFAVIKKKRGGGEGRATFVKSWIDLGVRKFFGGVIVFCGANIAVASGGTVMNTVGRRNGKIVDKLNLFVYFVKLLFLGKLAANCVQIPALAFFLGHWLKYYI
ncbi:hypothetical protein AYI69_g10222 [Smittium culicis]|uniref:Uncharacterized protein n=1 Tax=Smittium culicis TaxID=133412 RepID=A0A1R1X7A8_9FUNG|nr:hypothetical protein AYI69_g10222 [Smittium culicis]